MRKILLYIPLIFLLLMSCVKKQDQDNSINATSITKEANLLETSKDSIPIPQKVKAGKLQVIKAGKPTIVNTNTNLYSITDSLKFTVSDPLIITLGKNNFLLPSKIKVTENIVLAGIPQIRDAKNIRVKDLNQYSFSSYSRLQGLIHDNVKAIAHDNSGNMWFGSYGGGVSRFDGKRFTNYTVNEGLRNNLVWDILFDKSGNLWISTLNKGVSRFDGKYFTHFSTEEGLPNNRIWSILEDNNGNIWFGTDEGLTKFDGEYFTNYTKEHGLLNTSIASIYQDRGGNIWLGCYKGGGIMKFDGENFISYNDNEGFNNTSITAITEDNKNNIWFGKFEGGIAKYDGSSFTHYNESNCLNHRITTIIQDNKGYFWIGTFGSGLSRLDGKNITRFTKNEGMSSNKVYDISLNNNTVWITTSGGGVLNFGGDIFTHFSTNEGLTNNETLSILKDKEDNIWFGTYGNGISKYDGDKFYHYSEEEGLTDNNAYDIIQDKNGNIWVATFEGGASKFDGTTFTNYNSNNGLSSNQLLAILEDREGNIWMATYSEGAIKFDGSYFTYYTAEEGLSNNSIMCLLEDKNGNIWFGTYGDGAIKFNGTHFTSYTEEDGLCGNIVSSILEDKNGNIWFGTIDKGTSKYNGKYFTNFSIENGLSDNSVLSIVQDKNEDIWLGTRNGISRLTKQNLLNYCNELDNKQNMGSANNKNLETIFFERFMYEDGFFGNSCYRGAIEEGKDGDIWIGTVNKLTQVHPEGISFDSISPTIQLTGIELFNESIPWANLENNKDTTLILGNGVAITDFNFSGTSYWYGLPNNLSLKYNNNFLAFKFSGITQKQRDRVRYQYKLDGLDHSWSSISDQDEASYGNLSPGSYNFRVKAMNGNGYWSKEYQYLFTIRPPWWKTLWFTMGLAFIIIFSLLSFYFWRVTSLKKQSRLLEQLVKEKTAIVVQQKEDLEIQMNKLEIANATKDKFFSIIAHDLRSPFNSFLGLTSFMIEELQSLTKKQIKEMSETMNKSAVNLLDLLENLLHWAKMQQGLISFEIKKLSLPIVISETLNYVVEPAKNKGIKIVSDIPPNLVVYTDRNALNMVIRNLLTNALKYTHKGGKVTITAKKNNDNFIKISITDTGIGISDSLIKKLFRLDVQSNRKGTQGEPSTGLGLILCKGFIEKLGGKFCVESEEGLGSTFSFSLPQKSNSKQKVFSDHSGHND